MSIPQEVTYSSLPPLAYPTNIRIMRFLPNTNSVLNPSDIVRFNISTSGFWDPYTAYINLEIDLSQESALDDYDVLQIDGSASSFISEMVITCKGGELERISEYDSLANIIEDMTLSNEQRQARDIQGLGNNTRASNKKAGAFCLEGQPIAVYDNANATPAIVANAFYQCGSKPWVNLIESSTITADNAFIKAIAYDKTAAWAGGQSALNSKGGQTSWDTLSSSAGVGGMTQAVIQNLGLNFSTNYYNGLTPAANTENINSGFNGGIPNCFNTDLTQGCFEPLFSKNGHPMTTFIDGKYTAVIPQKRTFCVPIYSGILGQLIPKENYKYLPMAALEDMVLEFRLNQYAMFTSGYKPNSKGTWLQSGDTCNKYGQIPRKWKITKFEIVVEMLYFDKTIDDLIQAQLNSESGIVFHTESWYLGPIYTIPSGTTPSGTYQLNLGFESLKQIMLYFLPQDYLQYSFLRKLYRINCGITSFQLRIGLDLFPSLPLKGQAGTSGFYESSYSFYNNSEYIISLYKAWNKFQNKDEDISITCNNFAVNERYWYVTSTSTIPAAKAVGNYGMAQHLGYQPLIQENRCKGKAIFAMDLQSMGDNPNVISGLNTIKNRPFEILLTSNSNCPYTSGATIYSTGDKANVNMHIFCNYDMIVQLKKFGVSIMGRGGGI